MQDRLNRRINFLREIDRLKSIVRQSPLLDGSRRENSAEHSWHLAIYAWLLADTASGEIDIERVMRMLLLHDIVEIDAGDTPIHAVTVLDGQSQEEAEAKAAERIFGLLPDVEAAGLLALWREFEAGASFDAQFAKALDRFQPLLVNIFTGGGTWNDHGVGYEHVLDRYGPVIARGAPELWSVAAVWVAEHFGRSPVRSESQSTE